MNNLTTKRDKALRFHCYLESTLLYLMAKLLKIFRHYLILVQFLRDEYWSFRLSPHMIKRDCRNDSNCVYITLKATGQTHTIRSQVIQRTERRHRFFFIIKIRKCYYIICNDALNKYRNTGKTSQSWYKIERHETSKERSFCHAAQVFKRYLVKSFY